MASGDVDLTDGVELHRVGRDVEGLLLGGLLTAGSEEALGERGRGEQPHEYRE